MLADPRDRVSLRRTLDDAWERFILRGVVEDVRPEIARSWLRARDLYRIDPGLRRAPVISAAEQEERCASDETFEVARPVLEQFAEGLRGGGHVVAFADADGWLLSLDGDDEIADELRMKIY